MGEADLDEVIEIEKVSFSSPWTRQSFLFDLQENPIARSMVARSQSGELIAYACCWHLYDELRINNIAVHPGHRGEGVGRAILRRVLEEGRRAGCKLALLEVRPSNAAARALYESEGFSQVGRRKNYYREEREDALVLALELDRPEH
jgi:ribosomal-protein-alanine N-acetyltransferase